MNLSIKQFSFLATLVVLFILGSFFYSQNNDKLNSYIKSKFGSENTPQFTIENNLNNKPFSTDLDSLNSVADELQLWNENGVITTFTDLTPNTIESINIELTKTPQDFGTVKDGEGVVLRSYSFSVQGRSATLYLYFNPEYVSNNDFIQPEINFAIVEALMKASLFKPSMTIENQYKEINRIIDAHQLNDKPILIIQDNRSLFNAIVSKIIPSAFAQGSCGGSGACGQSTTTGCTCTVGGASCTNYGGSCGPGGAGECTNCAYECLQNTLESCNGSTQASCTNSFSCGDCLVVNGCRWTNPPPPPPNRWTCGSGYQCVQSSSGYSSYSTCDANCNPPTPPPQPKYSCSGTSCVYNPNGPYTSSTCGGNCNPPPQRYSCSGTSCVLNPSGPYTASDCGGACEPTKYACDGNACVVNSSGSYTTSNCDGACDEEVCEGCGCPGEPPCGCTSEHQCGDSALWDCCPQGCVPEGTPCNDSCSAIAEYKSAYVWVRVVSQENGGTVAWKGTQANDPVNTSGTNWSGDGINPATGYFGTYKPAFLSSNKTFDKNKNVISQAMRLSVTHTPQAPEGYLNDCKEPETYPESWDIPQAGTWSNHFCTAGYTYQISNGLPLQTNNYCKNNIDGPVFFKEDDVTYPFPDPRGLDCDTTPRVWPLGDPDGCFEGLRYPGGSIPTGQGEIRKSAHSQLVPLLSYAAGQHWADMAFDGYWTYTYMAWEKHRQTDDIDTVLTLYPPVNHQCSDIRWFNNDDDDNPQEQSSNGLKKRTNADGSCTAWFNPKAKGNLLIMEVSRAKNQSCTVQFEDLDNPGTLTDTLTTDGDFLVHTTGNSSQVIPPLVNRTRLYFAKKDFSQYLGTKPDHFVERGPYSGRFYYEFDQTAAGQPCETNSENTCIITPLIRTNTLDEGEYDFFCDIYDETTTPDPTVQCSGNTACSYNDYNTTNNVLDCSATPDCVDDSLSPRDHASVTLQCQNTCDLQCAKPGDTNACDDTACELGSNVVMTTVPPQLIKPDPTQEVTENLGGPTEYYFPITWNAPADTTNLDGYQYIVYKQGAFDSAQEAYDANQAHKNSTLPPERHPDVLFDAYTTKENLGFGAVPAPDASQYAMGLDFTAAVRAANALTGVCSAGEYVYSGWDTKDFTLVGAVSGNIYDDPEDTGSTSTLVTKFPSTAEVIIRGVVPSFDIRRLVSGNTYTVPTIPYNHKAWTLPNFSAELAINNNDDENWFVCSDAPGQFNGGENCTISDIASPQADTDFFVKSFNLRFESWWQSWGGNVFGRTGIVSAIPDGNDSPCADSSDCHPHLVAADHTQSGVVDTQSAGVPVIGSGELKTGDDSRFSEQNAGGVNNPRATGQETGSVTIENYTYFLSGTSLQQAALTGATKTRDAFASDLAAGEDVGDSTKVIRYTDNLTLDLSTVDTTLTIPSGEKYVVFVENDLEILGPSNVTDHGATDQDYLIRVNTGGYLAFIAGGNITFDSTIGYDDSDGSFDDAGVSTYNTPNVEGVYIASNNLIVETNVEKDYKFVGAGTFVGWTGVNLDRKFEGNTLLRKQLNNLSPTELFIHRADLVTNTPEFMMRPQLTWQEVR